MWPTLRPRQLAALEALLVARTMEEASARSAVPERTLRRWVTTDEHFRDAMGLVARERLDLTLCKLRGLTGDALDALRDSLNSTHEPTKLRAALGMLDLAVRVDLDSLAARVAALEAAHGDGA